MIKLKFADISISITTSDPELEMVVPTIYQTFKTDDPADISLKADWVELPSMQLGNPVFQSGGNWDLYKDGEKWIIPISFPPGSDPRLVAKFDGDYHKGDLLLNKNCSKKPIFPLAYPLDELLVINLLARSQGLVLHACAVALENLEFGLLFTGMSGAGKSTLTRLWQKQPGVTILSDDRVILKKKEDGYWIYGTPWHGDALGASAYGAPVKHIFVLKQAISNYLTPLKAVDVTAKLLSRSFPTFWDAVGMRNTLQFLDELSQSVKSYEFGFLPDQSAIDFILQQTQQT